MQTIEAKPGLRGIDLNRHLTYEDCRHFMGKGFRFAMRYVPRLKAAAHDITKAEFQTILNAGMGFMVVQHVEVEGWVPSAQKGEIYGKTAAECSLQIGYPSGAMVWLDLEGVDKHVATEITIAYCKNWYKAVARMGFTPGLYVGFMPGIENDDLYWKLPFEHYWAAYNVDFTPVVRGYQMYQTTNKQEQVQPEGWAWNEIDLNKIERDKKGGLPLICAPDEWDV